MNRRSLNIIILLLLIGSLSQSVYAEPETSSDNPFIETTLQESSSEGNSMEFTLPTKEPETDESGNIITTEETEPQTTAERVEREPAIAYDLGLFVAGVSSLFNRNDILSTCEPYKTDAEKDWDLRSTALEGYENFGISVVDTFLNVRDKASTDGNVIGKMTNLNACDILEKSDDGKWLKIQSGKVKGWVSSDFIKTGYDAKDLGKSEASKQVVIKAATLNVRSEPSEESSIWTQASGNERYDMVKQVGDWIEIELDTSTGFVHKDYVTVAFGLNTAVEYTPPKEVIQQTLRDKIVAYAMKWLGGRYVWAGTSLTNGVDCSGFTMKVYQQFGIYLSHYSGSQAQEGRKISRSELKKGDLVFYAKGGTINHVAIYIGDGMVVHARSPRRGICITDMNYRTPVRYVTCISD